MSGPASPAPPRLTAVLSALALGVVVYFALKILLNAPGNVLALICLVLMGLYIGSLARRGGGDRFAALCALGAAVLGALLAFVLNRA